MTTEIFSSTAALLVALFLLDLAVGDPPWMPHPVVLMGRVVSLGERMLRSGRPRSDFLSGAALSVLLVALSGGTAWIIISFFQTLPFWLSFIATAAVASTTVATRG